MLTIILPEWGAPVAAIQRLANKASDKDAYIFKKKSK